MRMKKPQNRPPIGPIGNAKEMLPLPIVDLAFDQGRDPRIGQRGNEQKSIEQAIEQAPAIGGERRPGPLQQIIRIRCEKRRFEQDIAYDLALLRLILQRFNCLPPPFGAIGRLLKKSLTEQPHGAMPPRERGASRFAGVARDRSPMRTRKRAQSPRRS